MAIDGHSSGLGVPWYWACLGTGLALVLGLPLYCAFLLLGLPWNGVCNSSGLDIRYIPVLVPGAYLGFCQGGCKFWLTYPPPPPDLDLDPHPHQDFELDPDLVPDPHQNNADPQPWAQLSEDCRLINNYV